MRPWASHFTSLGLSLLICPNKQTNKKLGCLDGDDFKVLSTSNPVTWPNQATPLQKLRWKPFGFISVPLPKPSQSHPKETQPVWHKGRAFSFNALAARWGFRLT